MEEVAWDTVDEDEEVTSEKGAKSSPTRDPPVATTIEEDVVAMMRTFLTGQQKREEGLIYELQGLRETLRQQFTPETSQSRRWDLPTPVVTHTRRTEAAQHQTPVPPQPMRPETRMPTLQEGEDVENYLRRYERLAKSWGWPEVEWACRLVPLLSGKALEAYLAMDEDRADVYEDLREALLEKFDISTESYRQRFRQTVTPAGETPTETYNRLKGLYRRWVQPERSTKAEIGEVIILEQLLRVLPYEVRTWVKEHEPMDGLGAARLATQYLNAHRGQTHTRATANRGAKHTDKGDEGTVSFVPNKKLVCFYCQQEGHKASNCPVRKSKLTSLCYVPREGYEKDTVIHAKQHVDVVVNGQTLNALLDTGSNMSLIKQCYVPATRIDFTHTQNILCVHGDQKNYPTTEITVLIKDQPYLMTVGVVEGLPVDMVLGWDLPIVSELLKKTDGCTDVTSGVSCPVLTRAQAKVGLEPLPNLDDSLIQGEGKTKKSRRKRRMEKQLGSPIQKEKTEGLHVTDWDIPTNIAQLQADDVTLRPLFKKVCEGANTIEILGAEKYVVENDVLYVLSDGVKRLVVPECCRPLILHLAHTILWSGLLAHQKTYYRISTCFFWPSMYTDVHTYCSTCAVCQKTSSVRRSA